ncbi:hypothetical protein NHJ6243_000781 [Beauveria neobassiana]
MSSGVPRMQPQIFSGIDKIKKKNDDDNRHSRRTEGSNQDGPPPTTKGAENASIWEKR